MMALHLNLNRDSKAKPEPFTTIDCMNFIEREPEKEYTQEELEAYANKLFG